MTAPSTTWAIDANTLHQLDMCREASAADPLFNSVNQSEAFPVLSGTPTAVAGVGGCGARQFPAGAHYRLDKGSNSTPELVTNLATLDLHARLTSAPGGSSATVYFTQRNDGAYAPIGLAFMGDGKVRGHYQRSLPATYEPVFSPSAVFPSPDWWHIRLTVDLVALEAKLYVSTPGADPVLVGTTALAAGSSFPTGDMADWIVGSVGALGGFQLGNVRLSNSIRSDPFPMHGSLVVPPTVAAAYSGDRCVLTFSRAVLDSTTLRDASRYSITPPGGMPAVTVSDVLVLSGTQISLGLSGDVRRGGNYSVALLAATARAQDDGAGNSAGSTAFTIAPVAFKVLSASPLPPYPSTKLRVAFSRAAKQVSAAQADDALKPANYSVTWAGGTLAVTSVASVSADTVDLTTASELPGVAYQLTPSAIVSADGDLIT